MTACMSDGLLLFHIAAGAVELVAVLTLVFYVIRSERRQRAAKARRTDDQ